MANNKVVFGQEVLIDLTQDTVTPYALEEGYTAHAPSGEKIVGVMKPNKPVEVETNAEMTAISTGATEKDLGKVYIFVGEDDGVFEKDALYILVKKGTGYGFQRYAIGGSGEESTPLQEKTVEITENRTTEVLPDEGYGLSKVIVTTNVAGKEDLEAELNEQEALIAELKEKLANGGGGSQECDCVIDVTELPSEYKDVNVYARFDESTYMTFLQLFQSEGNFTPDLTYYVVDTLPTDPKVSDFDMLSVIHCYIADNIPYMYGNLGGGNTWVTVSAMMTEILGTSLPDKGFTSDITTTTEAGLYVTYVEGQKPIEGAVYRLTKSSAEIYVVNGGRWNTISEFFGVDVVTIIHVVETLPENLIVSYNGVLHVYVVESTGVAYLDMGDGVMSFGAIATTIHQAVGGTATYIDGGWTDDIDAETEVGVYCVRDTSVSLNIFANDVWNEFPSRQMADEERNHAVEDVLLPVAKFFGASNNSEVTIPEGATVINGNIIVGWNFVNTIRFPKSLTHINSSGAVRDCPELKTIIFYGTPQSIHQSAFSTNCPKIATIYVPWEEGAVAGAPWGAPSTAAIFYKTDTSDM